MVELLTGVTQWRVLIVGLLMVGLALGLRRTDLDPGVRRRAWLAVSLPLLLWMAVVWRIALAGLFVPGRGVPGIPLAVLLPLLHDRMTEAVLPRLEDAQTLFAHFPPRPMATPGDCALQVTPKRWRPAAADRAQGSRSLPWTT